MLRNRRAVKRETIQSTRQLEPAILEIEKYSRPVQKSSGPRPEENALGDLREQVKTDDLEDQSNMINKLK